MKEQVKAIVFDLDGTLLDFEHKIGDKTVKVLEALAQRNIDLYIATGRNHPDVLQLLERVRLKDITLVTSNGARAMYKSGEVLLTQCIPEDIAFSIMNIEYDKSLVYANSYQGNHWYISSEFPFLKQLYQKSGISYQYQVVNFADHHGKHVEKIFYLDPSEDSLFNLGKVEQAVRMKYNKDVQITYSDPRCLEFMAKGVCKANTLSMIMENKDYTLANCLSFGDGMNDIEMLTQSGKACLMKNSDPRLKSQLNNFEIIGHHNDEAVAKYLEEFFGLGEL